MKKDKSLYLLDQLNFYENAPQQVLNKYHEWKRKWAKEHDVLRGK